MTRSLLYRSTSRSRPCAGKANGQGKELCQEEHPAADSTVHLLTSDVFQQICGVSLGAKPLAVSRGTWGTRWSWRSLEDMAVVLSHNVLQQATGCR